MHLFEKPGESGLMRRSSNPWFFVVKSESILFAKFVEDEDILDGVTEDVGLNGETDEKGGAISTH